ncbi:uncharacterized protein [Triticum aestivum]|uniref:uncharacterized protein n=1 Tax=Triticum aestivum TaxID=4565 RepID=UPI001D028B3D|nr:uncharacterized protein LOC123138975 [Triticum aestivum]
MAPVARFLHPREKRPRLAAQNFPISPQQKSQNKSHTRAAVRLPLPPYPRRHSRLPGLARLPFTRGLQRWANCRTAANGRREEREEERERGVARRPAEAHETSALAAGGEGERRGKRVRLAGRLRREIGGEREPSSSAACRERAAHAASSRWRRGGMFLPLGTNGRCPAPPRGLKACSIPLSLSQSAGSKPPNDPSAKKLSLSCRRMHILTRRGPRVPKTRVEDAMMTRIEVATRAVGKTGCGTGTGRVSV